MPGLLYQQKIHWGRDELFKAGKARLLSVDFIQKVEPYFQAHPIKVLTDQPLKQVQFRPETSGRLLKWNIELSQYDITYHPRRAINGQALADFIAECTDKGDSEEEVTDNTPIRWKLYVDGARND